MQYPFRSKRYVIISSSSLPPPVAVESSPLTDGTRLGVAGLELLEALSSRECCFDKLLLPEDFPEWNDNGPVSGVEDVISEYASATLVTVPLTSFFMLSKDGGGYSSGEGLVVLLWELPPRP